MKKLLITLLTVVSLNVFAQNNKTANQTSKGKILIETNTGFGAGPASTGFYLTTRDSNTSWNIGGEVGYFVADNFAIKAGLGVGDTGLAGSKTLFSYKLGGKYYFDGRFPVQLDLSSATNGNYSPMFLGLQGGYSWFIGDIASIEPGIRYNFGMNNDADNLDSFQFNIGFVLYL